MAETKKITKKKCHACGYRFDSNLLTSINKQNFCPNCAEKELKRIKDNKALNEYVYNLCGQDESLMPMLGKQIKTMKEEHDFKSTAILATLKYMYELKDPPVEFIPEYGIANVPYFFHQAKKFNESYFELKRKAEEEDVIPPPDKVITIKRSVIMQEDEEFWKKKKEKEMGADIDLNALIIIDEEEGEGD